MTTIAITNLKGGTAKTTSSILLAEGLRRLGHTPLILDADPQASASEWADTALEKKHPSNSKSNQQTYKASSAPQSPTRISSSSTARPPTPK